MDLERLRSLPHSEDVEKGLLSSMMQSSEVTDRCLEMDKKLWFDPAHRILFETLADIRKSGEPFAYESLTDRLATARKLEDVGGLDAIQHLCGYPLENRRPFVPCPDNWRYYLDLMKQMHQRRQTIIACYRCADALYNPHDAENAIETLRSDLANIMNDEEPSNIIKPDFESDKVVQIGDTTMSQEEYQELMNETYSDESHIDRMLSMATEEAKGLKI